MQINANQCKLLQVVEKSLNPLQYTYNAFQLPVSLILIFVLSDSVGIQTQCLVGICDAVFNAMGITLVSLLAILDAMNLISYTSS